MVGASRQLALDQLFQQGQLAWQRIGTGVNLHQVVECTGRFELPLFHQPGEAYQR